MLNIYNISINKQYNQKLSIECYKKDTHDAYIYLILQLKNAGLKSLDTFIHIDYKQQRTYITVDIFTYMEYTDE